MRDSKVRTIRPLNLTSDILVRLSGPLDAECAEELRSAVEYVVARPGGPIVVDCSDVSVVSAVGASVLEWVEHEPRGDRLVQLRHLQPEIDQATESPDVAADDGDVAGPPS